MGGTFLSLFRGLCQNHHYQLTWGKLLDKMPNCQQQAGTSEQYTHTTSRTPHATGMYHLTSSRASQKQGKNIRHRLHALSAFWGVARGIKTYLRSDDLITMGTQSKMEDADCFYPPVLGASLLCRITVLKVWMYKVNLVYCSLFTSIW